MGTKWVKVKNFIGYKGARQTMYYMNHDAVDYFQASFTPGESIVGEKHYPLGTFAVEMLAFGWSAITDIRQPVERFQEAFQVFLSSRDPSSAATALHAMRELWQVLGKLPVYNRLLPRDHRMNDLIPYLRRHPDLVDDMLTPGTPRNEAYTRWMEKLERLEEELQAFVRNTEWMLEAFFQDLPSRRRQDYIRAYADYRKTIESAMRQRKELEDDGETWEDRTVDLDVVSFHYPVNISLVPVEGDKPDSVVLAEQMTFESLTSFLYVDLYKGIAAGNLPRRCAHCRRWFLAVGGYDTRYCDRVVPGTNGKTCRKIGAHEREKEKRRTEVASREYSRAYNRLKARKRRGQITVGEWNQQVAQAQELKDMFIAHRITQEDYVKQLDAL